VNQNSGSSDLPTSVENAVKVSDVSEEGEDALRHTHHARRKAANSNRRGCAAGEAPGAELSEFVRPLSRAPRFHLSAANR